MKFDELYNRVFIAEQDEPLADPNTDVAHPDDFNDVDPIPLPSPSDVQNGAAPTGGATASSLNDFVTQIEDFAHKLNGTEGGSLQSLVSQLDVEHTAFDGIHTNTSADIQAAAKSLRIVSEKIKSFIIAAAKK